MTTIKATLTSLLLILPFLQGFSQSGVLDEIVFGNTASESRHKFSQNSSEVVKGGLNEPARVLLPVEGEKVEGGNITFRMKTDPEKQNYFTVRFWGSDSGNSNILILFCEGKQIGYRHLGDYDMLSIANKEAPFPGRFIYTTLPLPLHMTKGKKEIELSIRSTGYIYRYGNTFEKYQKPMTEPSKGIYKGYTHTEGYFAPSKKEKQGKEPAVLPLRKSPNEEVLTVVKEKVNRDLAKMMAKDIPSQLELWVLADAYYTAWTNVYKDDAVIEKIIKATDNYYNRFAKDSKVAHEDDWSTTGPLCAAIYHFTPQIREVLDIKMDNGRTRRENWSDLFKACVDYSKTHRRSYTNQSMIVDLYMYHVNRVLSIIEPDKALPAYQTLRYLYESAGISPWLGSETKNGPAKPLGDKYYQLTAKGLTKELGFVGGYGEIMNWMVHIYEATGERADFDSRDPLIRAYLLKMYNARSYFRYPSTDREGNRAMRAETLIGWRDHGAYPGEIIYGEKGLSREATPIMTAAATLDPTAVAYAQQMIEDNQFFNLVNEKMKDNTVHSTQVLLRIPDEYELIMKQPKRDVRLPMSEGQPDFVFSDEEDGVVAIKNGEEILYASLYWRANYAINFLARVHYITPDIDRIATVYQDVKFTDSGMRYNRPGWVNLAFSGRREYYTGVQSAHEGEELPIAKIPEGIRFKPGNESVFAGKGDFYTLRYGKYLIGMNCTKDRNFELDIPADIRHAVNLTGNKQKVSGETISVEPMSTVVLLINP